MSTTHELSLTAAKCALISVREGGRVNTTLLQRAYIYFRARLRGLHRIQHTPKYLKNRPVVLPRIRGKPKLRSLTDMLADEGSSPIHIYRLQIKTIATFTPAQTIKHTISPILTDIRIFV